MITELTKDELLGRSIGFCDDKEAFQNLSLDGRRSEKNRKHFAELAEKCGNEAYLLMELTTFRGKCWHLKFFHAILTKLEYWQDS